MIITATDGALTILTLDRPERRNALTRDGLAALTDAVEDASTPVLALRGAGEAFCAGADLEVVGDLDTRQDATSFAAAGQAVANALAGYDGATVAAIDGAARGGGLELALACDCRVCSPSATFAESGVDHGLFGAWGGTARLPAIVGPSVASDMALTGRVLDAEAARETGLVSRVQDDPVALAREIATKDSEAIRRIAALYRGPPASDQEAREQAAFAALVSE
jgi:enoyl-CoA hydratase/carnithine racemase